MVIHSNNLNSFFSHLLGDLPYDENTRAYIISIFVKYKNAQFDLSQESLTLTYAHAREKQDFLLFQTVGDWLIFAKTLYPEHLVNASEDYYISLGRLSYYSCYRLIQKQWIVYEQLADQFVPLTESIRERLRSP